MKRRGFTLIELLVVIAIIAILAAILFPVFSRARQTAHQANCASNIKQYAIGILLYADDNGGKFPEAHNQNNKTFWFDCIQPYVKNYKMGKCPSNPAKISLNAAKYGGMSTYGVNASLLDYNGARGLCEVKVPTRTVLLCDGSYLDQRHAALNTDCSQWEQLIITDPKFAGIYLLYGPYYWGPTNSYWLTYPYTYRHSWACYRPVPVHNGSVNVGFVDGHVKLIPIKQLIGPMPKGHPLGAPENYWDNM